MFKNEQLLDKKNDEEKETMRENRIRIVSALRAAGLTVQRFMSRDKDELFVTIGATQKRLEKEAEVINVPIKLNVSIAVLSTTIFSE